MNASYDCIVVGGGPTGAVLAALLGQRGHKVLVVERDRDVYPLPRAVHLDHEIARVLQEIGVLERLLPYMTSANEYRFENAAGELLLHNAGRTDSAVSGWQGSYMFVQPELEALLRRRLDEIDSVTTCYGCECVDFDATGDAAIATLRDAAPGTATRAQAPWLIGCDGASSCIRERLGIDVEDLGFDEPWVVIDAKLNRDIGLSEQVAYQFCDPRRPTTCVPAGPGRRRWEFMLLPGESPEEIKQPEAVWRLLAPWGDERALEIVRVAVYRFHALLARQWRRGRVLLAGDAAHQMPPFMGQGMCSGLRDAANLAWKLDRVLAGAASPTLLDSYQTERSPHVRRIVETSVAMGRVVCEQDPARAAERDKFMIDARKRGGDTLGRGQSGQAALLEDGILLPTTPGAGKLFPQPSGVFDHRQGRLDDLVGTGVRLFVSGAMTDDCTDTTVVALNDNRPDAFVETGGPSAAAWLNHHGAVAALVRPDHYVYGTATTLADAKELVRAFERAINDSTDQENLVDSIAAPARRERLSQSRGPIAPVQLAHVVRRTTRFDELIEWYCTVLAAKVVHADPMLAFLTYDDEHHRIAIARIPGLEAQSDQAAGTDHIAFTHADLGDLLNTYVRLKAAGIEPYWCINHGPTTSMYYKDPDGSRVELQVDNLPTAESIETWMRSGDFAANPIGVVFDPGELLERYAAGEPLDALLARPPLPDGKGPFDMLRM